MGLHVHNRKQCIELVPADVVGALKVTYFSARQPTRSQQDAAHVFLKHLRAARQWIACDCPGENQAPALMAPREPQQAEIHLFQFGPVQHVAGCCFARAVERTAHESQHDANHFNGPLDPPWTIRPYIGTGKPLNARLDQILRAAITRAGLSHIEARALFSGEVRGHYLRKDGKPATLMGDAIRHVEIDDGQIYEQAGLLHLHSIAKFAHTETVRNLARTAGGYVGISIGMVDEVIDAEPGKPSGVGLRGRSGELFVVYVERQVTGAEIQHSKGPYWAALALYKSPTDHALRVLTASVLPALDRLTGIPLMREAHRAPARLLLEQAAFWKTWKGTRCNVAIDFPIYEGVSGDAVISTPSGRMVETYFEADELIAHSRGEWGDVPEPVHFKGKSQRLVQLQLSAAVTKAMKMNPT